MESRHRRFEEDEPDIFRKNDTLSQYSGVRRRIARQDGDRVHEHLRDNVILIVLNYIYGWDAADRLKKRYGDLTQTLDRVLVGILGGASLLVPMIIMDYVNARKYRLIIVSLATLLFAAVMALRSASRDNVVAATAAYAAVMVVYIGSAEPS